MSNKWILIKLADEFNLQIKENVIFGQLNRTNQLIRIKASYTTPYLSVSFKLSLSTSDQTIEDRINIFNKKKLGQAYIEDEQIYIDNITGTKFGPHKLLDKVRDVISWWNDELFKLQQFEKYDQIALFKNGPDRDDPHLCLSPRSLGKQNSTMPDDRKSILRGGLESVCYAVLIGVVAAWLRTFKIAIAPLEMIVLICLVGKGFKIPKKSFGLRSLVVVLCVFSLVYLLEIFINVSVYLYLIDKLKQINPVESFIDVLVFNNKLIIFPVMLVFFILLSKIGSERMAAVVRGRFIDDYDRELAEITLKKYWVSLYSFSSIFLMLIPLFLSLIFLLHTIVYPSVFYFVSLFLILVPFFFLLNMYLTEKFVGVSPMRKHPRETKFEIFEENLGRFITSCFFALTVTLSVNVLNVMLDPFEKEQVIAILKQDYPPHIQGCVSLPLKFEDNYQDHFSFCEKLDDPPKAESKMSIWKGHGLFGIKYYSKNK